MCERAARLLPVWARGSGLWFSAFRSSEGEGVGVVLVFAVKHLLGLFRMLDGYGWVHGEGVFTVGSMRPEGTNLYVF